MTSGVNPEQPNEAPNKLSWHEFVAWVMMDSSSIEEPDTAAVLALMVLGDQTASSFLLNKAYVTLDYLQQTYPERFGSPAQQLPDDNL